MKSNGKYDNNSIIKTNLSNKRCMLERETSSCTSSNGKNMLKINHNIMEMEQTVARVNETNKQVEDKVSNCSFTCLVYQNAVIKENLI